MWTVIWALLGIGIVIVPLAIPAKFLGKGHLDIERSKNQYLGEVETFYRSPH